MITELVQWIEARHSGDGFCFSAHHKKADLLSTCFAVLALDTVSCLDTVTDADMVAEYILSFQESDGLFRDHALSFSTARFDAHYIDHQMTDFSLMALQALGADERMPFGFEFLDPYKNHAALKGWFESLNWNNVWLISNNIMFILNFLIYEYEHGRHENSIYIDAIFDMLDQRQDPLTGFWAQGKRRNLLFEMAGAFHFYIHYFYWRRPLKYIDKIIDATLALVHSDGLFHPQGGGGACEDLDAIDILVKLSTVSEYRAEDIRQTLLKSHTALSANQNDDGGFSWARRDSFSFSHLVSHIFSWQEGLNMVTRVDFKKRMIANQLYKFLNKKGAWKYSGCDQLSVAMDASDMWSAWFRPLSIALIEWRYPTTFGMAHPWQFRSSAGLGWHFSREQISQLRDIYSSST